MSDTVVNDSPTAGTVDLSGFLLDGEAPRLGAAPTIALPPSERPTAIARLAPPPPDVMPTLPVVSPVLTSPTDHVVPNPSGTTPGTDAEPQHPMAHLMPSKSIPNEASRRAAEKRAAAKAKAKKTKIGVITGLIVIMAVVGPPLGRWLVDAINEAGNTTTVEDSAD